MLGKTKEVGLTASLPGSSSATFINLQFADDMLIFGQNNIKEAVIIKRYFGAWSYLKINFHKSSVRNG